MYIKWNQYMEHYPHRLESVYKPFFSFFTIKDFTPVAFRAQLNPIWLHFGFTYIWQETFYFSVEKKHLVELGHKFHTGNAYDIIYVVTQYRLMDDFINEFYTLGQH